MNTDDVGQSFCSRHVNARAEELQTDCCPSLLPIPPFRTIVGNVTVNLPPYHKKPTMSSSRIPILLVVFDWRIGFDQVPRTIIGRLPAGHFPYWLALDVGALPNLTLEELPLPLAAAGVLGIEGGAHF